MKEAQEGSKMSATKYKVKCLKDHEGQINNSEVNPSSLDEGQYLQVWDHGSLPENGGLPPLLGGELLPQAKEFLRLSQGLDRDWQENGG